MHKTIRLFAGLTAVFAMGPAHAQATICPSDVVGPVYTDVNDETGHTYEIWSKNGITWAEADACARRPLNGAPTAIVGHLATVTSSSENNWLVSDLLGPARLIRDSSGNFRLTQSQVWIGGSRDATVPSGWRWANNEGQFPGVNGSTVFANWAAAEGEPNNRSGVENWVTLGRYPDNLSGWNDEGSAVSSIGGFVVEYDTPRTISECNSTTTTSGACITVAGQTLTFPAGSFDQDTDTIKFTAFEFNDPRVALDNYKCGVDPLTLFTEEQGFPANVELRIPPYLCGSPRFLVVKVDATDLNIRRGTVDVVNDTKVVLPDNLYRCFDPNLHNLTDQVSPPYSADPEQQDVFVWQSTDPRQMLEGPTPNVPTPPGVAPPKGGATEGIYFGTATEATDGCGTTRGNGRTGSYFVVGMHVEFPLGTSDYTNFFALTRYKLDLLMQSVRSARAAGAVKNPDGQAMESQLKNAITAMNANNPASALASILKFLRKVNESQYLFPDPITAKYNYQGDHLMRGENIAFTLRVKVIPFKP